MQNQHSRALSAVTSNTGKMVIIFFSAIGLRALPELFSGAYPVGFDTLQGYVPAILALPDDSPMKLFGWAYSPLAIYLLGFAYMVARIDLFLLIKIAGPIFYGVLSISFYYLLSNGLKWSSKKSFLVTLILILQPAVLRMGWDQFREELGLTFLFVLLGITKCDVISSIKKKQDAFLVLALSLLIVFSHQLVAILLFVVVLWQVLIHENKREKSFVTTIFAIVPSILIFAWQINGQFLNPMYNLHFAPVQMYSGSNIFAFTNYFLSDPRFIGGNYLTILSHVGSLSFFSFMPLIPFAIRGFSKDKICFPMLIWLIPASLSILVFPWFALQMYWWWILLLPIPLTIYLGKFLDGVQVFENKKCGSRKKIFGITLFMIGLLAVAYASSAVKVVYFDAETYMPSGMVESSIPFTDIPNVKSAITWANKNIPPNSTLIVQECIQGFSYSELRPDVQIRVVSSLLTLNQAVNLIPTELCTKYSIWYKQDVDYQTFPGVKVIEFGAIGIFQIGDY